MSKSAIPPQADAVASGVAGRDRQRLTWTIAAIILLLAGALGLKAWEERQTADSGMLAALEANSRAAAARLSGHAATADMALRLVAGSRASGGLLVVLAAEALVAALSRERRRARVH